ncbi:MAG TPA: YiiD C-terminal domain-containing protein [Solirubrobacterales bacterium]|nr:YiiD C-terminal domain-containing protein [Solirubrobacterales bacterium]
MTDFDAIAQGLTQAVPFAGHLGLEITSVADGEATVRLPQRPELNNHVGSQHAGALYTAAETASGAAFVGAFAERMGDVTPLARSAEIAYEKIAKGPIDARATLGVPAAEALATLDAEGKVEFPCEVELADGEGTRVATATVHWHVRLNKPAAAA